MKRAIVLQHAAFEGPAKLASLVAERGYQLDIRRLDRGELVPPVLDDDDLLIVMGGPMGIADLGHPEHPFLQSEVELLQRCIDDDAPVLGIRLGAQLLAHAAGALVHPMTHDDGERCYEVGWGTVSFHASNGSDVILGDLPQAAHVLHWHGDMFEVPQGARLLASSSRCRHQAFQLGSRMFGLQFHSEVDTEHVEAFLQADGSFVLQANGPDGIEQLRRDTHRHIASAWKVGERLLRNILDAMTLAPR